MQTRATLILSCVLCLAMVSARAGEGRIPIFEPITLLAGENDFSGNYVVTRNITTPTAATPVIQIIGDCTQTIEIDLNGFELTGPFSAGIAIDVEDVNTLVIRNGSIRIPPGSTEGRTNKLHVYPLRLIKGAMSTWLLASEPQDRPDSRP